MTAELGHFCLILAFSITIVQTIIPLIGAQKGWTSWMAIGTRAAILQFLFIFVSYLMLTQAFVNSDFSLRLVTANSHSDKPMIYKISGVWGNHEGSMLLWVMILSFYGLLVAMFGKNLPERLRARVLAIQGLIGVAFLAFLIFASNPFERLEFAPLNGQGLNPLLQDPGLAFHPPFLYLGYVGLSMSFSFAIAALIEGRVDAAWARWVRPWALLAWVTLTIGITLGSWWAYYELGWGGWWFWDPVENASLMPWLIAAALLHSAIVVEKRDTLKNWTILLAILGFTFSLIGTFIVRSGVITSVHAFANDPERGVFILLILAFFVISAFVLYAIRAPRLQSGAVFGVLSRESALVVNNLLLIVATIVVLVGTLWPLVGEILMGRKLSVGPPFFDQAFTPFMMALAMVLPIGALMPWKRAQLKKNMRHLWGALALSVALGALVWMMQTGGRMLAPVGAALAAWIILGTLADIGVKARFGKSHPSEALGRLMRLPRADWAKALAHIGLGIIIMGIAGITAWEKEDIRVVQIGESYEFGGYELTLKDVSQSRVENYISTRAIMIAEKDGKTIATLYPEKRQYPVERMPTTEAAIHTNLARDLYIVLGDPQENGGWTLRSYLRPLAVWLWIGSGVMALGGVISLTDRRFRLGRKLGRKEAQNA